MAGKDWKKDPQQNKARGRRDGSEGDPKKAERERNRGIDEEHKKTKPGGLGSRRW
jgi:hypothetical protein